jgi:hypothetical protein
MGGQHPAGRFPVGPCRPFPGSRERRGRPHAGGRRPRPPSRRPEPSTRGPAAQVRVRAASSRLLSHGPHPWLISFHGNPAAGSPGLLGLAPGYSPLSIPLLGPGPPPAAPGPASPDPPPNLVHACPRRTGGSRCPLPPRADVRCWQLFWLVRQGLAGRHLAQQRQQTVLSATNSCCLLSRVAQLRLFFLTTQKIISRPGLQAHLGHVHADVVDLMLVEAW